MLIQVGLLFRLWDGSAAAKRLFLLFVDGSHLLDEVFDIVLIVHLHLNSVGLVFIDHFLLVHIRFLLELGAGVQIAFGLVFHSWV